MQWMNRSIFTRMLALVLCFVMVTGSMAACSFPEKQPNEPELNNPPVTVKPTEPNGEDVAPTNPDNGDINATQPDEKDPNELFSGSATLSVGSLIYGTLADSVAIGNADGVSALVPADVKVAEGAEALSLSVKNVEIGDDVNLPKGETVQILDVHIDGIALDNAVPMTVNLGAVLAKGLSDTELKLYHIENDVPVLMTKVGSVADFAIHNQYTYNSETGEVSIYVASFSLFTAVQSTVDVWDGEAIADDFASGTGTEEDPYIIETAAQLVYFRNQVDAGATYEGQFVKLNADIDLADKLFDPIGFNYAHLGGQVFKGTFDGSNHTVFGLYQNGWDLDPDKTNYSTYTYSTAGGGLFASIQDATIKNLVVSGANVVFECVDIGIVVGYAQGSCHFENIVVTDSKIANYNRATGGVVGEVCFGEYGTDVSKGYSHTFKNITVDSSVKVSSLWGSFDTLCGGVIGGKWGDATVKMEDVTVACELDVFSDVTAAYQWYAYRRCGMLIGHTEQNSPKKALNAAAQFLTCENVKVYYGDWVNYTYYEFADQESDTGRNYPWVRAQAGEHNEAFSNPRYGVPTYTKDGVTTKIDAENCETYKTGFANITFGQLYGGGQGVYGCNEHYGVTIYNKTVTTIYVTNDLGWTDLKLQCWFRNGNDTWTTNIDGISIVEDNGVYAIKLPAFADGFKITGAGDNASAEIKVSYVADKVTYDLSELKTSHFGVLDWEVGSTEDGDASADGWIN